MSTVTFMPPVAIVPPMPNESLRVWRKSYETATAVFADEQAIALLPAYCNRNNAERTAAKEIATTYMKKTLQEALDALVEKVDGPTRPHEDAELFFRYEMKSESIFAAMYALKELAEKAHIKAKEVIAQKFLSILPPEIRTAILKHSGNKYQDMDLEKLLELARREESLRTRSPKIESPTIVNNIMSASASTQPPQWF